jgi:predicted nuclease with RNAse H fold
VRRRNRASFGGERPPNLAQSLDRVETVGIDIAARERGTAVCKVAWSSKGVRAELLQARNDDELVALIRSSRKVGIDCPIGWPQAFVATVAAHHAQQRLPARAWFVPRADGKRLDPLTHRLTDDVTWKRTGTRPPLSVSTNLLGVVALRVARLLDRLAEEGFAVDRAGTGVLAEVYPAAALRIWRIGGAASYKRPAATGPRADILNRLENELATRFSEQVRKGCISSHDDLDALISAVVARAVDLGHSDGPRTPEEYQCAQSEGWIHLPNCELTALRV